MSLKDTSKFISLILRHKPEEIGITLDEHGWANVDELISGISKTRPFSMADLEEIVRTDEKQRYSFNEDKTLIRANQGHSIPVDVELKPVEPPVYLYHGTGEKYVASINEKGILPKSRLYVHLSEDYDTAMKVGSRHGKPVVFRIWADKMHRAGFVFYKSVNGVWLTKVVPVEYFKQDSFDYDKVEQLAKKILEAGRFSDSPVEEIEDSVITEYGWEYVQQALFSILLDKKAGKKAYKLAAEVFWGAVLDGQKIKKKTTVALLYHRLGDVNAPYKDELIWSITAKLFDLDVSESEYNPLKDENILSRLAFYGLIPYEELIKKK